MQISTQNLRQLLQHQFDTFTQNFSKIRRIFFLNGVLVTSCHASLGRKMTNFQWFLEYRVFKQKRKQKILKDAKLNVLKNGYPESQHVWFLTPKNQNFDFFKKYLQNQNF